MYEIYCIQTGNINWKTSSVREAEEIVKEQNNYHKNDSLTFGIR